MLAALAGGLLLLLPWLPVFLFQLRRTGAPWAQQPHLVDLWYALTAWSGGGTGPAVVLSLLVLGLLVLALVGHRQRAGVLLRAPVDRPSGLLLGVVAGSVLLGVALSMGGVGGYSPRYTSGALVLCLLVAARGTLALPPRARVAVLAVAAVAGLGTAVPQLTSTLRTQAPALAAALRAGLSPGDVVVYCPDQLGPSVSRLLPAGHPAGAVPDGRLAAARQLGRLRRAQRLGLAVGLRGHRLGPRRGRGVAGRAGRLPHARGAVRGARRRARRPPRRGPSGAGGGAGGGGARLAHPLPRAALTAHRTGGPRGSGLVGCVTSHRVTNPPRAAVRRPGKTAQQALPPPREDPLTMASTKLSAAVLAGLLTVSLAACGSNDTATGTTPATSSSAAAAPTTTAPASPKVLAELPDLSKGESTTVTLSDEFLQGITDLKVTPGVVGDTKLTDGKLIFPITGGMATLYEQGTTGTDPFIVGVIEHDGQGITLTAGGKDGQAQELRRRRRQVGDPHGHRRRRRVLRRGRPDLHRRRHQPRVPADHRGQQRHPRGHRGQADRRCRRRPQHGLRRHRLHRGLPDRRRQDRRRHQLVTPRTVREARVGTPHPRLAPCAVPRHPSPRATRPLTPGAP